MYKNTPRFKPIQYFHVLLDHPKSIPKFVQKVILICFVNTSFKPPEQSLK